MSNKKFYVRFWDNAGNNRSIVIKFPSLQSADAFIEKWQHFGGILRFEVDYWGESYEKNPCDVGTPYLFGKNNTATAKVVNQALFGRLV